MGGRIMWCGANSVCDSLTAGDFWEMAGGDCTKNPNPTKTGLLGGQEVGSQGSHCRFCSALAFPGLRLSA